MARLPIELLREIVSILSTSEYDDPSQRLSALSSTSLTSKLCYEIAAPYLYEAIELQNARQAHLYLDVHLQRPARKALRTKFLWCGVVATVLYDVPHQILQQSCLNAEEVSWLQADSAGRYHGFHYALRSGVPDEKGEVDILDRVERLHVVCPDLGRWCLPLFSALRRLRCVVISIYPRGNWDLEAAKIESILKYILRHCLQVHSVQIVLAYTVAAAGSRMIRMTRAIPVSRAVNAVDDERVTLKSADFMFGRYGWTSSGEVIEYTRMHWLDRLRGGPGPWAALS